MVDAALGRARRAAVAEAALVLLLGWLLLLAFALGSKGMGLTWDALNHHFYLGWVADAPRMAQDFLPAGYQSLQYPYLYWPAWQLAQAGADGRTALLVLTTLHATAVLPLWLVVRACLPGDGWYEAAMRGLGVLLAFLTAALLSLLATTSNDVLAAIPLVWSFAFALLAARQGSRQPRRLVLFSGACAGLAVAFKFSNGPIAILLPLLWLFAEGGWRRRAGHVVAGSGATLAVFALAYGYWGWQLWLQFGNPFYPFLDGWVVPLRAWLGVPA